MRTSCGYIEDTRYIIHHRPGWIIHRKGSCYKTGAVIICDSDACVCIYLNFTLVGSTGIGITVRQEPIASLWWSSTTAMLQEL